MLNDGSHADERGYDAINPDSQKETNKGGRNSYEEDVTHKPKKEDERNETQKEDQLTNNEKKENTRVQRGWKEWGGYQGY